MSKKVKDYTRFPSNSNQTQFKALANFRNIVNCMELRDKFYDDQYLLRFLRTRINKIMFNDFIECPKENDVDYIRTYIFGGLPQVRIYLSHDQKQPSINYSSQNSNNQQDSSFPFESSD